MVTMPQLRDADPGMFSEAAEAWDRWAKRYDGYAEEFGGDVDPRLEHWRGHTSELAKGKISRQREVLRTAPPELRGIAATLRSAGSTFIAAQQELNTAIAEASQSGFTVDDDGSVQVPPVAYAPERRAAAVAQHNKDMEAADGIAGRIREAVRKATDADQTAAAELRAATKAAATAGTQAVAPGLSPTEAAGLVRRAARGDTEALDKLRQFRHMFADPYFAHELTQALGARRLTELPGLLAKNLNDAVNGGDGDAGQITADNQALLGMLSDALAASTNPNNPLWASDDHLDNFLDRLQHEGRSQEHTLAGGNQFSGYWGLGQIMNAADGHPPYSTEFLDTVGRDMVAWDKERVDSSPRPEDPSIWPGSAGPFGSGLVGGAADQPGVLPGQAGAANDPLLGLLNAASTNGEGAQELFLGNTPDDSNLPTRFDDQSNLEYLLSSRPGWADQGNDLGNAIEAAATAEDPNDPQVAERGARVALGTVDILGRDLNDDFGLAQNRLSGMADSVGEMLGDRIGDVNDSVNGSDIEAISGTHARFGHQDLAQVLKFATKDQDGFDALAGAQLGHIKVEVDDAAARHDLRNLEESAAQGSRTLGVITEARVDGLNDDAEAQDQAYGLLATAAKTGVGMAPIPGSAAAAEATDIMLGQMGTNAISEVRTVEASYDSQANSVVGDMVARSVADHKFYSAEESPEMWLGDPDNEGRPAFIEGGEMLSWENLKNDPAAYGSFDTWTQGVNSSAAGHESARTGYSDGSDWYTTARDAEPGARLPERPDTPQQAG